VLFKSLSASNYGGVNLVIAFLDTLAKNMRWPAGRGPAFGLDVNVGCNERFEASLFDDKNPPIKVNNCNMRLNGILFLRKA
jgi:hypothetical protein